MKVRARRDFLDPYSGVIHVVGTVFELPDADLCQYLIGMNVLENAVEEDEVKKPVAKPVSAPVARPPVGGSNG
jgi:hypothetical protein